MNIIYWEDVMTEKELAERIEQEIHNSPNKNGAWILIRNLIPVEIPIMPLSIWYATPQYQTMTSYQAYDDRLVTEELFEILTPYGTVTIREHEYSVIKNVEPYIQCTESKEYNICWINSNDQQKKNFDDVMFYMQTRGISKTQAFSFLAQNNTSRSIAYLEPHTEVFRTFFYDDTVNYYLQKREEFYRKYPSKESYLFVQQEEQKILNKPKEKKIRSVKYLSKKDKKNMVRNFISGVQA